MKASLWFGIGVSAMTVGFGMLLFAQPLSWTVTVSAAVLLATGIISAFALWKLGSEKARRAQELARMIVSLEEQLFSKYETIAHISHRFATATEEAQVLNWAMELMLDLVNAKAAAFTPIDELGATLGTRVQGELPAGIAKEWIEYLSSPTVRRKCPNCNRMGILSDQCPLVYGKDDQFSVYCVPVRRPDQELGIFHLFLTPGVSLGREQEFLVRLISDQTALALEGARLRSREVDAHFQLEAAKHQLDVGYFIEELLRGLVRGLEVEAAIVSVWDARLKKPVKAFSVGAIGEAEKERLYTFLSRRSLEKLEKALHPLTLEEGGKMRDILLLTVAIPIERRDLRGVLQILLPAARREFTAKQEEMLKAVVTQISFLLQNANLLAEVEIKAILQERIRLAREIHDGLAQTLGFLKLKISQLRSYLDQGEFERANQTVQLLYQAVQDAYIEARHAIDQLRASVYDAPLAELLQEALDEFRESSGIPCELVVEPQDLRLPVEINAQLVRIVQESLSNVRKHARAHRVQIQTAVKGDWLILEVRDDGVGFQPEEVSRRSQYGLRGMKERAELIGAELQIISQPNQGATVQVRLPLSQLERSWQA
ncbi:MAG: sensor histidine kinase [Anaerolineales bacterium]|nr:sensor histidine kinase [Anaerolineales bacterium]MCS7247802.1 sensor histidine kinase [Anaerolineales bacterium]MDW8161612.1 sensor histidine kinase [Anaerolineales bacterium]MDW8446302.1 sensor histidine kinase [Anaerolineales bacterium]